MNKAYTRIVWENYPSESTPLNEQNLNKMDSALDTVDNRVVTFASTKANQTDLLQSLKNVTYNETTGLFTFTWWNGTTKTVDLNIEKIPVSFSMSAAGVITMTNTDGTTYTADVSTLIKLYTFNTSSDIRFNTVTDASGNKTITAFIVNGSVTEEKLQPNFLANCRAQVAEATAQATKAQSYAEGGTGTRTGEDTDNAKYYYEQTQAISPAYDGIAVISDSTAPLTLPNSKRGGFNLTDVGGKWEQFTTTGKNLLPMTLAGIKAVNTYGTWNGNNYTLNGVTFDMLTDDDGNVTGIKANGTASNNVFFNLCANITLPGGTYTISGDSDNEHIISNLYIQSVNTTPIVVYQAVETFTLNESTEFGVLLAVFDGKTVANQMFYPMLELGSRATTYEPYTGGIPAPNPDYPQSVNPVEIGEITEHGFNWWDEEWELGSIDGNGQNTSTSTEIRTKNYIPIIAGASYYVKQTGVQVFHFYNANYGYLGNEYISDSQILIIPADTKYMKFRCANTYGTVYKNDICINISDAALNGTYEPYHSATQQLSNPITLYGNGDVKDEIVRLDDGSLKVLRKYGQVDLGVLSWQFATNYFAVNKDHIRNATGRDIRRDMDGMLSCSFYRYMPGISGDHRLYQTSNAIRIRDDSYTDVTTFKASLDGVMLVYELAEPYYEDIPVVDQIALNSLKTFDTVTYVDFNSDVKPTVSGEYGVSKVGGYTLKAMLQAQSNGLRISELENAGG